MIATTLTYTRIRERISPLRGDWSPQFRPNGSTIPVNKGEEDVTPLRPMEKLFEAVYRSQMQVDPLWTLDGVRWCQLVGDWQMATVDQRVMFGFMLLPG